MTRLTDTSSISNIDVLLHVYKNWSGETRKKWFILTILFLTYIICTVSEPFIYQQIIDLTLTNTKSFHDLFYGKILYFLWAWGIIIIWGIISFAVFQYIVWKYLNIDSGNLAIYLVRQFLLLPIDTHSSLWSNEIQKTFDRTANGQWEIANAILNRLSIPVAIFFCMITLGFYTNTFMTVICLIPLPIWTWWLARTWDRLSRMQSHGNDLWDNTLHRIADALINIRIIKLFARKNHEIQIIKKLYDKAIYKQLEVNNWWAITESASEWFQLIVKIIVFSVGIYQVWVWDLSIWELILFLVIIGRIYGPIMSILYTYRDLIKNIANYKKWLALLTINSEKDSGKREFKGIKKSLIFKDVGFIYPETTREVLQWVNIEVKKWEKIALIGHTGSGKSTIVQLLMRFYSSSSGGIEIDGIDIEEFTLDSYRKRFASVFQDTTLFNESIRHNLEYVRDGVTDGELQKACREANILDFIESLPEWWETEVGERGLKLSGWEKQRIAIARAILADPEILILDEATSALDTETERLIQDSLEKLMEGRTSIIIAHRLSTIQHVDRIYMLDGGQVIASGNHSELMKTSDKYRHLIELQHDGFIDEEDTEENP